MSKKKNTIELKPGFSFKFNLMSDSLTEDERDIVRLHVDEMRYEEKSLGSDIKPDGFAPLIFQLNVILKRYIVVGPPGTSEKWSMCVLLDKAFQSSDAYVSVEIYDGESNLYHTTEFRCITCHYDTVKSEYNSSELMLTINAAQCKTIDPNNK